MNDADVRGFVYDATMRSGRVPLRSEVASALGASDGEVLDSLKRLAEARMIVLQRDHNEILMANPFSAVPTAFPVTAGVRSYYANCIWDALGIPAMLNSDARIETSCGDCGAAMAVEVNNGRVAGEGVLHFAVKASHWWNDIVFN